MTRPIPAPLLSQFSEFVAQRMGLNFPEPRWDDLERAIRTVAAEFGQTSAESCAQWLLSAPLSRSQMDILAAALTVGETYFFRDKRSFELLGERIFPELFRMAGVRPIDQTNEAYKLGVNYVIYGLTH